MIMMFRRTYLGNNNQISQQDEDHDSATTILRRIICSQRTQLKPIAGYGPTLSALDRSTLGLDFDEVYPCLFIGDKRAAMNKTYLQNIGVTHVLNVAEDLEQGILNAMFYQGSGLSYMGIAMQDSVSYQISPYFPITANYIDLGIKSGGKVLVNCKRGVSRSSTVAVSYLMIKHNLTAPLALHIVCQQRQIRPNDGFLEQLARLNEKLHCDSRDAIN